MRVETLTDQKLRAGTCHYQVTMKSAISFRVYDEEMED